MDFINLIIGGLLLFLGITWYLYMKPIVKKEDKKDYILKSFNIEIYFGIIVLVIVGVTLVYRELKTLF